MDALNIGLKYKDLLLKTVCSVENKECMLAQCDTCLGKELLTMYLYEIFGEYEDDFEVYYKQLQTIDHATLLSLIADVPMFVEVLVSCFEKLQAHSFTTSHVKSPCDGISGTAKRLAAQESLKRPYRNQILTSEAMYEFCIEKIKVLTSFT